MKIIARKVNGLFCSIAAALVLVAPAAQADLIGDTKTTLNLRNFYFNRDNEGVGKAGRKLRTFMFVLVIPKAWLVSAWI